jgi:spermidine/putrescine transport system substrate-binding protein
MPPPPRRWFLRRLGLAGAGALAGAGLAGCAADDLAAVPRITAAADRSASERVVVFANWPQYVDQAGNPPRYPTLREFTRQTGIDVAYSEPINSNEEFLGRIGIPLALGENTGYDLVVISDWMIPQFLSEGWLEKRPPSAASSSAARLLPRFRDWPVPDVARYSLPWQAGFTGIGYNERLTGRPVTSMTDLLTSADLRGKVSLVADMRDVVGLVMLEDGTDPSSFRPRDFARALRVLQRAMQAGQVRVVSDYYPQYLIDGTVAAGVAWAGDILYYQPQHPGLHFTWPATGGMLWTDNMVIPALARHPANAEKLMSFYYRPDVAVQLSAYELYLCPAVGAREAARRADPALAAQQWVFPSAALLRTGHMFKILTAAQSAAYTSSWEAVVGL